MPALVIFQALTARELSHSFQTDGFLLREINGAILDARIRASGKALDLLTTLKTPYGVH